MFVLGLHRARYLGAVRVAILPSSAGESFKRLVEVGASVADDLPRKPGDGKDSASAEISEGSSCYLDVDGGLIRRENRGLCFRVGGVLCCHEFGWLCQMPQPNSCVFCGAFRVRRVRVALSNATHKLAWFFYPLKMSRGSVTEFLTATFDKFRQPSATLGQSRKVSESLCKPRQFWEAPECSHGFLVA